MTRAAVEDVFAKALDRLQDLPAYRDVYEWADQRLGVQLWSVQSAIAASVQSNPRTACWSCHDSGKSFLAAVLACHHVDTHRPREARVITTAPSGYQVRGVLWVEINGLFERARELSPSNPLPGRVNQTEWWIGSYMAGVGRKPNEYSAEQFAGFHARYPLVILDEADGLPPEMWEGIEALLTNRKARLLAIGNPLNPASEFAALRSRWERGDDTYHGVVIPYRATPNFSGEAVSELVADNMLSREWVETKRRAWGDLESALADPDYEPRDNPYWWGRVLAEYPPEDSLTIVTAALVALVTGPAAQEDLPPTPPYPSSTEVQLGVDMAGSETGDYTWVRERVGRHALRAWKRRTGDDDELEDFLVECAELARPSRIVIDAGGVGFGFTGRIRRRINWQCRVVPVQFGARATVLHEDGKTKKFANFRAQLYWEVAREGMRRGLWNLAHAEYMEETVTDLTAPRLAAEALADDDLIQVEEKSEVRRRLKRSPDLGDATLLAYYAPAGGGPATIHSASRSPTVPRGASAATASHRAGAQRRRAIPGERTARRARVAVPRSDRPGTDG